MDEKGESKIHKIKKIAEFLAKISILKATVPKSTEEKGLGLEGGRERGNIILTQLRLKKNLKKPSSKLGITLIGKNLPLLQLH